MTANDSNDKDRSVIFSLFYAGRLFKSLLLWFLVIALIPIVVDRYFDYAHASIYLIVLLIIFVTLLAFIAAKGISDPIEKLLRSARQAASGKFDQIIEISTDNEIGALALSLNDIILKLKDAMEENDYQAWLNNGRFALIEGMRKAQGVTDLCGRIITFVCEYVNAQTGIIYIRENSTFRLYGSYAYARSKNSNAEEFKPGEGLLGQVALEKIIINLTDVPDDHLTISSGLGEMVPRNILIVPIPDDNGDTMVIIEVGTIYGFPERIRDLFDFLSKSIAIALDNAQSRQKMDEFLEKTLSQAEELKKQQEDLRKANEKLEEETKAHKESEERLKIQQEELKQKNEVLKEQTQILEKQKEDMKVKNLALEEARRLLEDRAKEVEIASQYKSQFLANMSHELRTPLNSIILLSQLLSDNRDENLTEKQVEYAKSVQSSGYDLLKLINEILDLSKVESGKVELNIEDVPLIEITNAVERNFKPVVAEKNISFTISIDDGLPPVIRSDSQRIEQVLKNLLSNAFKFTSRGGIELRISRPDRKTDLSLSGLRHDQCISFAVSDTGIGIPKEKLSLIFDAFQQADGSTSRKYGGTGLGLSISKELAGILGGEIQAESKSGKGATFILYLPESPRLSLVTDDVINGLSDRNDPLQDTAAGKKHEKTDKTGQIVSDDRDGISENDNSILIIDDDPKFTEALRDFFRKKGLKVVIEQDGKAGLHLAEIYKPSAIILDIKLPVVNGWTVMTRLKENNETRHIPVYFISASDSSREAMKMGAADFIQKPVSMEDLEKLFTDIEKIISKSDKSILLVEDNLVTRKIIEKLFDGTGVRIVNVSTGEEAMEKLADTGFDCVILDLSLPDMSGFEILSAIKNNRSRFASPIIVYTGKKLTAHERAILDEYTESIIVKGVNSPAKLLAEVSLYIHLAESKLPEEKRKMLRLINDKESIFKDKKILLTDDDMRNVFVVTNILEQKGMRVLVAKNGYEALDCLRNNHDIDLVIMDMMMPEMDGFTAIKKIRKQKIFASLPIISLTAKAMKGDRAKCLEAGASDYLSKPFEKERLFSILRAWLY